MTTRTSLALLRANIGPSDWVINDMTGDVALEAALDERSLPALSQEFKQGPQILISSGHVTLRWDSEGEDGSYAWSSAEFTGVEAVAFTSYSSCTADQARAYDRLIKVDPSDMLANLKGASSKFLQHFRIYFDETGCLDVIAEDFLP